jgi:hypothetical protein
MVEKTEEQIAADKAALDAMRNARAHMNGAISRIETLESALRSAVHGLREAKGFTPSSAYVYGGAKSVHDKIDEAIAAANKALG